MNEQNRTLTILLLGESGVGKSTFINAFANYLQHCDMVEAAKNPVCLIPECFTQYDDNSEKFVVTFGGRDNNERTDNKYSYPNTQYPRCYEFSVDDFTVKMIDTPGTNSTEGILSDERNIRNLYNFICQYEEIDAICVFLRPNVTRLDFIFY